jgi:hypothetical protein
MNKENIIEAENATTNAWHTAHEASVLLGVAEAFGGDKDTTDVLRSNAMIRLYTAMDIIERAQKLLMTELGMSPKASNRALRGIAEL